MKRGLEGGDEVIMGWKKKRSKEGRNEKNNRNVDAEREATLSFYLFYLSSYSSPFSIKIQSDFSYMLTF